MDARALAPGVRRDDLAAMGDEVVRAFLSVRDGFFRVDAASLGEASRLVHLLRQQEQALIHRMVRSAADPGQPPAGADEDAIFVPMHLERAAEHIELLGAAVGRMIRDGVPFTDRATGEIRRLFGAVLELLEGLRDALRTGNRTLVRYIRDAGRDCEAQVNEFALFHEQRLIEGVCQPKASSIYLAMLDHLRGIGWHARQVAENLGTGAVPGKPWSYAIPVRRGLLLPERLLRWSSYASGEADRYPAAILDGFFVRRSLFFCLGCDFC